MGERTTYIINGERISAVSLTQAKYAYEQLKKAQAKNQPKGKEKSK